jgi:hypothetical protein
MLENFFLRHLERDKRSSLFTYNFVNYEEKSSFTRLEREKCSSLLSIFVSDEEKRLLTLIADVNVRKLFSSALRLDWKGTNALAYLHINLVNYKEKRSLTLIADINVC